MKCFEINLLLHNPKAKEFKDLRQYFQQEKGSFQALLDTLAWVHLQMKRIKTKHPEMVIERLIVWQWDIATPSQDGEIKTKKFKERVLNWSFERGVIDMQDSFSNKQKRRTYGTTRFLNKYRHVRAEIIVEEVGRELITEDVTCIAI